MSCGGGAEFGVEHYDVLNVEGALAYHVFLSETLFPQMEVAMKGVVEEFIQYGRKCTDTVAYGAVLTANFYINVQQMLHNYICCNIKAQQMLQFVLFNLCKFRSKCWTIYIDYKHSVAAAFIMALIACWISFFREF